MVAGWEARGLDHRWPFMRANRTATTAAATEIATTDIVAKRAGSGVTTVEWAHARSAKLARVADVLFENACVLADLGDATGHAHACGSIDVDGAIFGLMKAALLDEGVGNAHAATLTGGYQSLKKIGDVFTWQTVGVAVIRATLVEPIDRARLAKRIALTNGDLAVIGLSASAGVRRQSDITGGKEHHCCEAGKEDWLRLGAAHAHR